MQWGCTTKPGYASDLKVRTDGTREPASGGESKWRLRYLHLLWRALATIWPKRLPNVGSLFHAVPRGDQFLPKDLAKPKIFLWPRITPELSRTALRRRQRHDHTRLCRRREAVSA